MRMTNLANAFSQVNVRVWAFDAAPAVVAVAENFTTFIFY